jgi:phosphoribosylaminoimidazole carboxylase
MYTKTIGVIGGGQLCKMLVEAGIKWDLRFNVLESNQTPSICNKFANCINGSLHDPIDIQTLANMSDIITYELENINVDALMEIEINGKTVIPSAKILKLIQDKLTQKEFMMANNIPTAQFTTFNNENELRAILQSYQNDKFVVKNRIGGYDGKGVIIMTKDRVGTTQLFPGSCLFEEYIDCKTELAVIVARDQMGNITCYPVVEMVFNDKHTLDYQICPANITPNVENHAKFIAAKLIDALDGVGIFGVEMFLTHDNDVLVNEISPRPHNSGHYTIEACNVSQYEQLLRIMMGYPIKPSTTNMAAITMNLLGPDDYNGSYELANKQILMSIPNCHIHMYGKQPSTPNRKLGHVTIVGTNRDELIDKFKKIKNGIYVSPAGQIVESIKPVVGVIMGSISDLPVMQEAVDVLKLFGIPHEVKIVSAHRTPDVMFQYATNAEKNGLQIIIAGAGGAAHLPGMCSSLTNLPVIGVPIKTDAMAGLDSLYSIVQMPKGVPVATMAINGAKNAAILAIRILALNNPTLQNKLDKHIAIMHNESIESNSKI